MKKTSELIRNDSINCSVVVVAAGASSRFGEDKLSLHLLSAPVLAYSLAILESCDYVREVVVVVSDGKLEDVAHLCDEHAFGKVSKIVLGGASRTESALAGASECSEKANLIAIHDGARPLLTKELLERVIKAAHTYRAAVPGIVSRDTIKIASRGRVLQTTNREATYAIQTPQVFDPTMIKGALTNALKKNLPVYDDAGAVEALGFAVCISEGSEENIKITTPLDMILAEAILHRRKSQRQGEIQ